MKEKKIIDLNKYKETHNFLFIEDKIFNANIYPILNNIENNTIIPRYLYGAKKINFNFNLIDEIEKKLSNNNFENENCIKIDFNNEEVLQLQKKLNQWLDKNIFHFIKDEETQIDIFNFVLELYPYSIINKNEIHIIK